MADNIERPLDFSISNLVSLGGMTNRLQFIDLARATVLDGRVLTTEDTLNLINICHEAVSDRIAEKKAHDALWRRVREVNRTLHGNARQMDTLLDAIEGRAEIQEED